MDNHEGALMAYMEAFYLEPDNEEYKQYAKTERKILMGNLWKTSFDINVSCYLCAELLKERVVAHPFIIVGNFHPAGSGDTPMMNPFGDADAKLRLMKNPKTAAYFQQENFRRIIEELHEDPRQLGWVLAKTTSVLVKCRTKRFWRKKKSSWISLSLKQASFLQKIRGGQPGDGFLGNFVGCGHESTAKLCTGLSNWSTICFASCAFHKIVTREKCQQNWRVDQDLSSDRNTDEGCFDSEQVHGVDFNPWTTCRILKTNVTKQQHPATASLSVHANLKMLLVHLQNAVEDEVVTFILSTRSVDKNLILSTETKPKKNQIDPKIGQECWSRLGLMMISSVGFVWIQKRRLDLGQVVRLCSQCLGSWCMFPVSWKLVQVLSFSSVCWMWCGFAFVCSEDCFGMSHLGRATSAWSCRLTISHL